MIKKLGNREDRARAIVALVCLTILEAAYMYALGSFSSEIFAAISMVVGTILGAFFGQKA